MWCQAFMVSGILFLKGRTRNSIPGSFNRCIKELLRERCKPLTHGRKCVSLFGRVSFSTTRTFNTHTFTSKCIRPLDGCKWLKMFIPPNSPLQCPTYPVLSLAPLKATWEPTVSENQSMFWYLSVNFIWAWSLAPFLLLSDVCRSPVGQLGCQVPFLLWQFIIECIFMQIIFLWAQSVLGIITLQEANAPKPM